MRSFNAITISTESFNKYGSRIDDARTVRAVDRVLNSPYYRPPDRQAPNGYFKNRIIIGRNTGINGGVYLGGGSREALVVDDTNAEDKILLDKIYSELLLKLAGNRITNQILNDVFDIVQDYLPYNDILVRAISSRYKGDSEASLCHFIRLGAGVCRHQSVLVAYLVERLIRDNHIAGKISAERNSVEECMVHAWARFESAEGNVYIIDPAQNYCGRLEDVPDKAWPYNDVKRPDEIKFDRGVYEMGKQNEKTDEMLFSAVPEHHGHKCVVKIPQNKSCQMAFAQRAQVALILAGGGDESRILRLWCSEKGEIYLLYASPSGPVTMLLDPRSSYEIGRDRSCPIIIPDSYVSGNHCRIDFYYNRVVISDRSRNGTHIEWYSEHVPQSVAADIRGKIGFGR